MVYEFTWSGLNAATAQFPPQDTIWFGNTLLHILKHILDTYTNLITVYINKADLVYAYIWIWFHTEYVPSVA